jgi:hypothetical protein
MTTKAFSLAILLLGASGVAFAGAPDSRAGYITHLGFTKIEQVKPAAAAIQAPEIDPASLVTGLTLLGAGLVVMRGRRAQKPTA